MYAYAVYFQIVMILALVAVIVCRGKFSRCFMATSYSHYLHVYNKTGQRRTHSHYQQYDEQDRQTPVTHHSHDTERKVQDG